MIRRNFLKTILTIVGLTLLPQSLFAKKTIEKIYLFNTDNLYSDISKKTSISYDTFYKHLEFLYNNSMISYPRTKATLASKEFNFNNTHLSKQEFKSFLKLRSYAIDWDNHNIHMPLTSFVKHKVNMEYLYMFNSKPVFNASYSEFGGEDIPQEQNRYGEKLEHLDLIFSTIQNRTNQFYNI